MIYVKSTSGDRPVWAKVVSHENLPYLMKGLRYTLGYSLVDVRKLGLMTGLVGNWETGMCGPNKVNWEKILSHINKSGKDIKEIIRVGKTDFSLMMKSIMEKLDIPEEIFIRFITSTISQLGTKKQFRGFLNREFGLSPKNKNRILYLNELAKKHTDARQVIFNFRKDYLVHKYSNVPLIKEFIDNATKFKEIININPENSEFESRITSLLRTRLENVVKNPIVSDEDFRYITEIDVCGKYRNKTVFILCKDSKSKAIVNTKREISKKIELINQYLKPDFIWLATPQKLTNKAIFVSKYPNTSYVTEEDLNRKSMKELIKHEPPSNLKIDFTINKGGIFLYLKNLTKLSRLQLANALNISLGYMEKLEKNNTILSNGLQEKVKKFLSSYKNLTDIRRLHFTVNKKISTNNSNGLILKYMRNEAELTGKELSSHTKIPVQWILNYESGRLNYGKVGEVMQSFFKQLDNYHEIRSKAEKRALLKKEEWETASRFKEIINLRGEPVNGYELENYLKSILKELNCIVVSNPVVANKDMTFKKEVDIIISKNRFKAIIECEERKNNIKWEDKSMILKDLKNICNNVIFVSDRITKFGKDVLKKNGIIGLSRDQFKNYFLGVTYDS